MSIDLDNILEQLEDLDAAAVDEKIAELLVKVAMYQRLKAVLTGEKIPKVVKRGSYKPRTTRENPPRAVSAESGESGSADDLKDKRRRLVEFLEFNGPSSWSAIIGDSRIGTQAASDLLRDESTFVKQDGLYSIKHGARK